MNNIELAIQTTKDPLITLEPVAWLIWMRFFYNNLRYLSIKCHYMWLKKEMECRAQEMKDKLIVISATAHLFKRIYVGVCAMEWNKYSNDENMQKG